MTTDMSPKTAFLIISPAQRRACRRMAAAVTLASFLLTSFAWAAPGRCAGENDPNLLAPNSAFETSGKDIIGNDQRIQFEMCEKLTKEASVDWGQILKWLEKGALRAIQRTSRISEKEIREKDEKARISLVRLCFEYFQFGYNISKVFSLLTRIDERTGTDAPGALGAYWALEELVQAGVHKEVGIGLLTRIAERWGVHIAEAYRVLTTLVEAGVHKKVGIDFLTWITERSRCGPNFAYEYFAELFQVPFNRKLVSRRVMWPVLPELGEDLLKVVTNPLEPASLRVEGIRVLGRIGDPRSEPFLIGLLEDKEPSVKIEAARALGKIGGLKAVKPLLKCVKDADASMDLYKLSELHRAAQEAARQIQARINDAKGRLSLAAPLPEAGALSLPQGEGGLSLCD